MKIIVTGGAGFIGSCIIRMLNDMGIHDIIIVDNINTTDKWLNIRNKFYTEYIHKNEFLNNLHRYKDYSHIIHMGACSSTAEEDFDYLYKNNFGYTKALWQFTVENKMSYIYASSAATYGDGTQGFDDKKDIKNLFPLNPYGYSKHLFDLWVEKQKNFPQQYVGLKFFNVYGPNEYFKGKMTSMIYRGYRQIKETGKLKLYKSYKSEFNDGEQKRDFVYIKDICHVIKFFLENPSLNGLYNVGTDKAETFNILGKTIFSILNKEENIIYIDMPELIRRNYQYFTQSNIQKLYEVGYKDKFLSLAEGIYDYVLNYLEKDYLIY